MATDAVLSVGYHRVCGNENLTAASRHRPGFFQSSQYRKVITYRIARDMEAGWDPHKPGSRGGAHINGDCGGELLSCKACRTDAVELLLEWAKKNLAPPVQGEPAVRYWQRVHGPLAERWRMVAKLLTKRAKLTEPLPTGWVHCACCGFEGQSDGRHICAERLSTKAWHAGWPNNYAPRRKGR